MTFPDYHYQRVLAALSELADDAHAVAAYTGAPRDRFRAEAKAEAFEVVARLARARTPVSDLEEDR